MGAGGGGQIGRGGNDQGRLTLADYQYNLNSSFSKVAGGDWHALLENSSGHSAHYTVEGLDVYLDEKIFDGSIEEQ